MSNKHLNKVDNVDIDVKLGPQHENHNQWAVLSAKILMISSVVRGTVQLRESLLIALLDKGRPLEQIGSRI